MKAKSHINVLLNLLNKMRTQQRKMNTKIYDTVFISVVSHYSFRIVLKPTMLLSAMSCLLCFVELENIFLIKDAQSYLSLGKKSTSSFDVQHLNNEIVSQ